jgi:hypothetical protein
VSASHSLCVFLSRQHALTAEQLKLAEDRRLEAQSRITQLQNELADAEQVGLNGAGWDCEKEP